MTDTLPSAGDRAHANTAAAALNANRHVGALPGVAMVGVVLRGARDWTTAADRPRPLAAAYAAAAAFPWRKQVRPPTGTAASAAAAEC
ncbi:MAG: hypothetical protein ACTHL8_22985 [Burkholderiaceae bacterium]